MERIDLLRGAGRRPDRRGRRRARADRLDDRRRERRAGRARPGPGRRGADQRRGAPGRARAARSPARAPRGDRARGAVRRAGGRGRAATPGWSPARTCPGRPGAVVDAPRWPPRPRWCCSTARRGSAPCRSTCARSAATSTPPPARSGCAARTASATSTCAAELRRAPCSRPGPATATSPTPRARSSSTSSPTRRRLRVGFPRAAPRRLGAGRARRAGGAGAGGGRRRAPSSWPPRLAQPARRARAPARELDARLLGGRRTPEAEVARLAGEGFVVRDLPGTGTVRASVGAWSSEDDARPAGRAHFVAEHHDPEHDRRRRPRDAERADQPVDGRHARRGRSRPSSTARVAAQDRQAVGGRARRSRPAATPRSPSSSASQSIVANIMTSADATGGPCCARRANRTADADRRSPPTRPAARPRPCRTGA